MGAEESASAEAGRSSLRILVVCTANVCRSPMAEALLTARAAEAGLEAVVSSAGTRAGKTPVDPVAVRALAELGADIAAHVPRRLTRDLLATEPPDLILTMTREHLRDVAVMGRSLFPRTFTLREAVRRFEVTPNHADPRALIAAAGAGRRPSEMLGAHPADEVEDPYGSGFAAVMEIARDLDDLSRRLVGRLIA